MTTPSATARDEHALRTRPLLVVNPASGGGRTAKTFSSMLRTITDALGMVEVVHTKARGDGIRLAREGAEAGHPLIIAVGGDGTFHEVVNGVLSAKTHANGAARVGLIAQGTGGDFRRTLGLEHRLDRYVAALRTGRTRTIDVGKLRYRDNSGQTNERWFVNILSAGMGGLVDRYVADTPSGVSDKAAYFGASLRALARCREGHLQATVRRDGTRHERRLDTYMIAICNGRYFGGGMMVAPMASLDDGAFEVVSMGASSKLAFALVANKIYDGSHLRERGVEHFTCDGIDLELLNEDAREVFLLDVDGEPLGGLPLSVELVRNAITLQA